MKLTLTLKQHLFRVDIKNAYCLSIPLMFDGAQPNHFGAEKASAVVMESGGFVGDTSRGGSCNVKVLSLNPHCNGTHTESISHIIDAPFAVGELATQFIPATLITVIPEHAAVTRDSYAPPLSNDDKVISRAQLESKLEGIDRALLEGLIIRTLPNPQIKMRYVYNEENQPPFFTQEAMHYLSELGVQHLLVDFPSVDKMYDDGLLTNHHIFWQVEEKSHQINEKALNEKTITEMIYVSDAVDDDHYLLSLNIPHFLSDAAPSRPVIYPLEKV